MGKILYGDYADIFFAKLRALLSCMAGNMEGTVVRSTCYLDLVLIQTYLTTLCRY